jgi:hypothetical protein
MVTRKFTNQHVKVVKKQLENRPTDRRVKTQNTAKGMCQVSYTRWEITVVAGGGLNGRSWSELMTVLSYRVCTILLILLSEGVLLPRQLLCETMKQTLLERKKKSWHWHILRDLLSDNLYQLIYLFPVSFSLSYLLFSWQGANIWTSLEISGVKLLRNVNILLSLLMFY